ncbi:hypothetical protein AURDEDRAFT_127704 [Auricularia subglabra TFB-10046 SS5]|nr:hypothetical protein AURDEDRAFT_127704 [Auricularia subglabra TFB-10046 SS5]
MQTPRGEPPNAPAWATRARPLGPRQKPPARHHSVLVIRLIIWSRDESDDLSEHDELSALYLRRRRQKFISRLPLPELLRNISPPSEEEMRYRHDAITKLNAHLFHPPSDTLIVMPTDESAPMVVLTKATPAKRPRGEEDDDDDVRAQSGSHLMVPPRKKRKKCRGRCGKDFAQSNGRNAHWDIHPDCESRHAERIKGSKEEAFYRRYRVRTPAHCARVAPGDNFTEPLTRRMFVNEPSRGAQGAAGTKHSTYTSRQAEPNSRLFLFHILPHAAAHRRAFARWPMATAGLLARRCEADGPQLIHLLPQPAHILARYLLAAMNPIAITSGNRYAKLVNESDNMPDDQTIVQDAVSVEQTVPAFLPGLNLPLRASNPPSSPSSTRAEPSGSPDRAGTRRKRVPGTPSETFAHDDRKVKKNAHNNATLAFGSVKPTGTQQNKASASATPASHPGKTPTSAIPAAKVDKKGKGRATNNMPPPPVPTTAAAIAPARDASAPLTGDDVAAGSAATPNNAQNIAPPAADTTPVASLVSPRTDSGELSGTDMEIDSDSTTPAMVIKSEPDEVFIARQLTAGGPIVIDDDDDDVVLDLPTTGRVSLPPANSPPSQPTPRLQPVVHTDMIVPDLRLAPAALPSTHAEASRGQTAPPSRAPTVPPPQPPVAPLLPTAQLQAVRPARFPELRKDSARSMPDKMLDAAELDEVFGGTRIRVNAVGGHDLIDGLVENEHVQAMHPEQCLYFEGYSGNATIIRIIQMEDVKLIRERDMPRALKRFMRDMDLAVLDRLPNEKVMAVAMYAKDGHPNGPVPTGSAITFNLSDPLYNAMRRSNWWCLGNTRFRFDELKTGRTWFLYTAEGMELEVKDLPEVTTAIKDTWRGDEYVIAVFHYYSVHNLGAERCPLKRFIGSISADILDVVLDSTPVRQVNIKGNTFDVPVHIFRTLVDYLRTTVIRLPAFGELRAFAKPWTCKTCSGKSHSQGKCVSNELNTHTPIPAPPPAAALPLPPMPTPLPPLPVRPDARGGDKGKGNKANRDKHVHGQDSEKDDNCHASGSSSARC